MLMSFLQRHKTSPPTAEEALPGRDTPIAVPERHFVLDTPLEPPFPDDTERAGRWLRKAYPWFAERLDLPKPLQHQLVTAPDTQAARAAIENIRSGSPAALAA